MSDAEERKLLRKLLRASEKPDDLLEMAKSYRALADYYLTNNRYEEALPYYIKELSVHEDLNDKKETAQSHRMIGECYTALGRYEESLTHTETYYESAVKLNDTIERQRALATKGRTYFCWASDSTTDKKDVPKLLTQCKAAYQKSLSICENELKNIDEEEKYQMTARLMYNLGLASELEEDFGTAQKFLSKAIRICRIGNLCEDLHRCYILQGNLFIRQKNFTAGYASFDSAVEAVKTLPNSKALTVFVGIQKAEAYFAEGKYVEAKKVLRKMYKMKTNVEEDRYLVEIGLRRAILLSQLEGQLEVLVESKILDRKMVYEKLGDAWCAVKNYPKAIEYYHKMLAAAERLGTSDKDSALCFVSLSQTYKDNKQFDLALEYANRELEISKKISCSEEGKTYLSIGEILELQKANYIDTENAYLNAWNCGKASADEELQYRALQRLISLQNLYNRTDKVSEYSDALKTLPIFYLDTDEDEPSDDIHLEDIITDSESEETTEKPKPTRPHRTGLKIVRNEKGETQLHVAAIRGDVAKAEKLLDKGHPVHEQDLNGWTPLHEACNHGHLPVVKLLIENGANVNDTGGKGCGGITPLHDAASCGHFSVIDYLLEKGASVVALTDSGETPLECFRQWRGRVKEWTSGDEIYFKLLSEKLMNPIDRKNDVKKNPIASTSRDSYDDVLCEKSRRLKRKKSPPHFTESYRKRVNPDSSSDEDSTSKTKTRSCDEYRSAMQQIRRRSKLNSESFDTVEVQSNAGPLLNEEDVVDDWLDDDMGVSEKAGKNKSNSVRELTEKSNCRQSLISKRTHETSPLEEFNETEEIPRSSSSHNQPVKKRAKPNTPTEVSSPDLYKVRLKINERLFLISLEVVKNHLDKLTVQWLVDEAIERYRKLEDEEPIILLETEDGAVISENDPLKVILNEPLIAKITGFKTYTLADRYREAWITKNSERELPLKVCQAFGECEFNIENFNLLYSDFVFIFQALRYGKTIKIINLSNNVLNDVGLLLITKHLDKLNFEELYVKGNNISKDGLRDFIKSVGDATFSSSLRCLDLSFNPIGEVDDIKEDLISTFKNLQTLDMKYCEIPFS